MCGAEACPGVAPLGTFAALSVKEAPDTPPRSEGEQWITSIWAGLECRSVVLARARKSGVQVECDHPKAWRPLTDPLPGITLGVSFPAPTNGSEHEAPADEVGENPGRNGDPLRSANQDEHDGYNNGDDQ